MFVPLKETTFNDGWLPDIAFEIWNIRFFSEANMRQVSMSDKHQG